MKPNSSPESTSGATRNVRSGCSARKAGSQTWIHALPDTCARATTTCLLLVELDACRLPIRHGRGPLEHAVGSRSTPRRWTAACSSSATPRAASSSSSSGMARDMRAPNVCSGSSGARWSPYTRRFASSSSQLRAGTKSSAAIAAATSDSPSTRRLSSVGLSPKPSTTTTYTTPTSATSPPASIVRTSSRSIRSASRSKDDECDRERNRPRPGRRWARPGASGQPISSCISQTDERARAGDDATPADPLEPRPLHRRGAGGNAWRTRRSRTRATRERFRVSAACVTELGRGRRSPRTGYPRQRRAPRRDPAAARADPAVGKRDADGGRHQRHDAYRPIGPASASAPAIVPPRARSTSARAAGRSRRRRSRARTRRRARDRGPREPSVVVARADDGDDDADRGDKHRDAPAHPWVRYRRPTPSGRPARRACNVVDISYSVRRTTAGRVRTARLAGSREHRLPIDDRTERTRPRARPAARRRRTARRCCRPGRATRAGPQEIRAVSRARFPREPSSSPV